jgi:hypothetical protein
MSILYRVVNPGIPDDFGIPISVNPEGLRVPGKLIPKSSGIVDAVIDNPIIMTL